MLLHWKHIEGFFPLTRPGDESSGRADAGVGRRGATIASRTVGSDRGGEQTGLLADDSAPSADATGKAIPSTWSRVKDGGGAVAPLCNDFGMAVKQGQPSGCAARPIIFYLI